MMKRATACAYSDLSSAGFEREATNDRLPSQNARLLELRVCIGAQRLYDRERAHSATASSVLLATSATQS